MLDETVWVTELYLLRTSSPAMLGPRAKATSQCQDINTIQPCQSLHGRTYGICSSAVLSKVSHTLMRSRIHRAISLEVSRSDFLP
jgi:hypothetical protein